MTVLFPNPCYKEASYKGPPLYFYCRKIINMTANAVLALNFFTMILHLTEKDRYQSIDQRLKYHRLSNKKYIFYSMGSDTQ